MHLQVYLGTPRNCLFQQPRLGSPNHESLGVILMVVMPVYGRLQEGTGWPF